MVPAPDLTPRAREIVAVARELLESEGPEGLSMRRIAAQLGIRAPSLYEHVADKRALENAIISEAFFEQGDLTRMSADAARAVGEDPLLAIGSAYRRYALAHPHVYRLMTDKGLDRAALVEGSEQHAGEALRRAVDGDLTLARVLWAFAHGMIMLELNDRFAEGSDADELWDAGLRALRASTRAG
ncbi:TetR/AcrR family transcriptional regulator [Conexibacter sp. CPCC 206217]|uniref:TetR/AcrR family transcriptional regulator n=1 Tax=Conexibacter sp. CPCC 206217 TaxID=3064574 RepID=UPI0027292FA6|nr:TetR/AcrR family transcriptional regulator [Conexibacter sp. CPCC 206217]MDO8211250.1 WHG domain-containing protein [Conexibacter sp. CPCC 206217]